MVSCNKIAPNILLSLLSVVVELHMEDTKPSFVNKMGKCFGKGQTDKGRTPISYCRLSSKDGPTTLGLGLLVALFTKCWYIYCAPHNRNSIYCFYEILPIKNDLVGIYVILTEKRILGTFCKWMNRWKNMIKTNKSLN